MRFILLLMAAMCMPLTGQACRYQIDHRPLGERMSDRPLVFIGKVLRIESDGSVRNRSTNGHAAVFAVERAIKGVPAGSTEFAVPLNTSSCAIRFEVGARYLYAGSDMMHPTTRIDEKFDYGSIELTSPATTPSSRYSCGKDDLQPGTSAPSWQANQEGQGCPIKY